MDLPELDFLNPNADNKIPVPSTDFLRKPIKRDVEKKSGELIKYKSEYESFCRWSALPDEERKPKTQEAFEKKHGLPRNYCAFFKSREDYRDKRLTYFWDWMMDKLPNVVYAQYKRAIRSSSTDAKFFAELISKHIDIDKPVENIQPLVLVGVPQDKIDKLFTPIGYENVEDIVPEGEVNK